MKVFPIITSDREFEDNALNVSGVNEGSGVICHGQTALVAQILAFMYMNLP